MNQLRTTVSVESTNEFLKGLPEHGSDVSSLGIRCTKALRPADELAMIDAFLTKQSKSKSNRLHMSNTPDRNVDSLARIRELSSSLIRIKKESKRLGEQLIP